jgi:hypothetical protein
MTGELVVDGGSTVCMDLAGQKDTLNDASFMTSLD